MHYTDTVVIMKKIFFEDNFLNLVISCNEKKFKFVRLKLTQLEIFQNPEMQKIVLGQGNNYFFIYIQI